ncbi:hypothetical protein LRK_08230 [Lacticaseibacillus rhamnosus K32]|uniref:Uncharacterized protein n=1 Tax=Lacticaseibacillus paracasei TaxID=1597 RepID=A0A422M3Q2_LACPA|nr:MULTISPECIES: hypothetical protein [Lacticaseibacillus]KFC35795.1 hypothetical protein LRK_08230 [Lacticaseibacillus rhamnosus K32]KMO90085.1 hypothetical protein ACS99_08915 [Lacticaseibacillus rhamnosus]RND81936.1 hypothetical protein FAM18157_01252 [Lacticaseibacillus paracasei]WHM88820.1 hypothetical protein QJQ50_08050 [Lacticaseibacillus rhamnosus]
MGKIEAVNTETGEVFKSDDWDKLSSQTGLSVHRLVKAAAGANHRTNDWYVVYTGVLGEYIENQ